MKARWFVAAACLAALLLGLTPRAYAGNDKATAHRWYTDGKRLYDVGDYVKALDSFKRAYLAYEEPSFLFNMAQCDRALGNKTEAIWTYKSYLRNVPNAPNRVEVERVIKQLEGQLADERQAAAAAAQASEAPPPVVTPAPIVAPAPPVAVTLTASPPPAPKKRRTGWIWPVAGVVVAGAAVGIALGLTIGRPNEATLNKVQF